MNPFFPRLRCLKPVASRPGGGTFLSTKYDKDRDPYTFSLRGLPAIASFVAPTAIDIDRLNRMRQGRLAESAQRPHERIEDAAQSDVDSAFGRFWLRIAPRRG